MATLKERRHEPREDTKREEEWFDAFFDLIFAVAVSFWAERVARDPTLSVYLSSLGYLIPVFWIWLGQTIYSVRFGRHSTRDQAFALLQVVGVGIMSVSFLTEEVKPPAWEFPVGYIVARCSLVGLYVLARHRGKHIATHYIVGFGVGLVFWGASLFVPEDQRGWLWAAGIGVEFSAPWLGRRVLQAMPLDGERLPARVGIFISLLLGISVEGIVRGIAERGWTTWSTSVALLSLTVMACLWWMYAARINPARTQRELGSGQPYVYSHLPIVIGAGTASVGTRVLQANHTAADAGRGLLLIAVGVFAWVSGMLLLRKVVLRHQDRLWYLPFCGATVVVPLVAIVGATRPARALVAIVLLLIGLTLIELRHGKAERAES